MTAQNGNVATALQLTSKEKHKLFKATILNSNPCMAEFLSQDFGDVGRGGAE